MHAVSVLLRNMAETTTRYHSGKMRPGVRLLSLEKAKKVNTTEKANPWQKANPFSEALIGRIGLYAVILSFRRSPLLFSGPPEITPDFQRVANSCKLKVGVEDANTQTSGGARSQRWRVSGD